MIPAVDLFCGLGGFTEGAKRTGKVDVRLAINHEQSAIDAHLANHPGVEHVRQDLLEFDMRMLPDLEMLIASPSCKYDTPCGRPSAKGTGGNFRPDAEKIKAKRANDRNTAHAVLAACEAKQPRLLIVENVPEFTERATFGAWLNYLEAIGYNLAWRIVNAMEVGGAVDRPRFILTGQLGGPAPELPIVVTEHKTIADCLDPDDHPTNRWRTFERDSDRMRAMVTKAKNDAGERCFFNNVGDGFKGRTLDDVLPSLTTKSASQFILVDGNRRRVLNSRELARGMGFGEDHVLPPQKDLAGVLLGNAIHVDVAEYAIEQAVAA